MVCDRCILAVKEVLDELEIKPIEINLGEVKLETSTPIDIVLVEQRLQSLGFALLHDKRQDLVKEIKKLVAVVYSGSFEFPEQFRFSNYSAEKLDTNYQVIASSFSTVEQLSLEKYILDFRIEKAKELLVYSEKKLADISFELGFSSVSHLSKQFKMLSGLTPSHFKEIRSEKNTSSPSTPHN